MQASTDLQKPNGLAVLQQLLSVPQDEVAEQDLIKSGLSQEEAKYIIGLRADYINTHQRLAVYENKANEPLLQKQQQIYLDMINESGKSGKQTGQLITELKESLIENASGTLGAFNRVLMIYTVAFIIGVLLICTAVVFGVMGKTVLAIAFGTIGLIDIMTYFFKLPASKIQESRSNLSQLQVVLLVWLKDLVNNDVLSAKFINVAKPSIADYKALADINIHNTEKLLKLIQDLAEPKD